MNSMVEAQLFHGICVGRCSEVWLSHLQFADDTLIIGEKSWLNVRSMRAVLLLFEEVSGLKVNFHKSLLTGVNITESWLTKAATVMNCRRGTILFVYLGLPICEDSRRLSFWKPVVDSIVGGGGGEDNRKIAWINWDSICSLKDEGVGGGSF